MAAGHGAGAGGHEEPLLVVLAPAAPQAVAVLLALGAAQLADQALRHHLVKALPVLLGDENPGRQDKGRGEDWGRGGRGTELWILLYQGKERPEQHQPLCAVSLSLPQSCEHQGAGLGTPGMSGTEGTLGTPGMLAASPALSHARLHQGEEFRAQFKQLAETNSNSSVPPCVPSQTSSTTGPGMPPRLK